MFSFYTAQFSYCGMTVMSSHHISEWQITKHQVSIRDLMFCYLPLFFVICRLILNIKRIPISSSYICATHLFLLGGPMVRVVGRLTHVCVGQVRNADKIPLLFMGYRKQTYDMTWCGVNFNMLKALCESRASSKNKDMLLLNVHKTTN